MFQKFTILGLSFALFFLAGCGADKKSVVVPTKTAPTWYTKAPLSNGSDLYAVGEGKSKKEAISNALNLMASTLSVSISSSYNAKTVVKEGSVSTSEGVYANEVQSDVKEIRISNYEVLNAESLGFKKYAVLLKSNKKKLFDSMLQETEQKLKIINDKEQTYLLSNGLKKLVFYREAQESLKNLPNTLIVMNVLNPTFKGEKYLEQIEKIDAKYEQTLKGLSFSIDTDRNSANLKTPISKGLSAKKLKINRSVSNMHFSISIASKIQKANAYGFTLARSEISIVTRDTKNNIVGSNSLHIVGQSSQGYEVAKQDIAFRLNTLIEKEGIAKVIGLDI